MSSKTQNLKAILIPGNGGGDTNQNFFPYIQKNLEDMGITTISPGMYPDPEIGRESVWIPYLKSLGADEHTILIGHSTGAIAAMRYADINKIFGSVLIAPYHTDLGLQNEKDAEYFDTSWDWEAIKNNQNWIIQLNSTNDPFIPIEEARFVHEKLNTNYRELQQGHFYPQDTFPELIELLKEKFK